MREWRRIYANASSKNIVGWILKKKKKSSKHKHVAAYYCEFLLIYYWLTESDIIFYVKYEIYNVSRRVILVCISHTEFSRVFQIKHNIIIIDKNLLDPEQNISISRRGGGDFTISKFFPISGKKILLIIDRFILISLSSIQFYVHVGITQNFMPKCGTIIIAVLLKSVYARSFIIYTLQLNLLPVETLTG